MKTNLRFGPVPPRTITLRVAILPLLLLFSNLTLGAAEPGAGVQRLKESLADSKWLWYGREDRVVTLEKDGTFALDDWSQQGITAKWEATASKIVTVTVTSKKFKNLTATLLFADDLGSFTGTDLDKNRVITESPRLGGDKRPPSKVALEDLTRRLGGTKWLWQGRKEFVLELRKNGTFDLDAWKKQGIEATWRATGRREATVTVTSQKFRNQTATLVFDEFLKSFTGTDLDKNRKISPSPRVP